VRGLPRGQQKEARQVKVVDQEFQMVELDGVTDRLKEHPKNPKQGAMAAIHESINVNGFYGAVVAQSSTGYILAGNHRYRAAVQQKAKEIPVFWVDVDDETAERILAVDNRSSDLGTYDEEALQALLDGLPTLEGTGYGLDVVEEQENTPAPIPAPPGPSDIPEDSHESQWGVVVMCNSEAHQAKLYKAIQKEIDNAAGRSAWKNAELRVVAI
jgi:ParB-like chromosome segregation protein Spo0J